MMNPFVYGRALDPPEVHGRAMELRKLSGRIQSGQSMAVVGQPNTGKTSLLRFVYKGPCERRDAYRFLDAQMLRAVSTQEAFWKEALHSVVVAIESKVWRGRGTTELKGRYQRAVENAFGSMVLEQLFESMELHNLRLVLLIDEFDDFLSHPVLNSAEFYGCLRSIASRTKALVLVIATRKELAELNQLTQDINPHGSPYFNVFTEIVLGALPKSAIAALLKQSDRFDSTDREFISWVSGSHPYVAQVAASALWEAHEDGCIGVNRFKAAGREVHGQLKKHYSDCWKQWSVATRKSVTIVALRQFPHLCGHAFDIGNIADGIENYTPELENLELTGCLTRNGDEWGICQVALLWWLADELRRNMRQESDFQSWLRSAEMDGVFSHKETEKLSGVMASVLGTFGRGVSTLIESFAKGIAEGSAKVLLGFDK